MRAARLIERESTACTGEDAYPKALVPKHRSAQREGRDEASAASYCPSRWRRACWGQRPRPPRTTLRTFRSPPTGPWPYPLGDSAVRASARRPSRRSWARTTTSASSSTKHPRSSTTTTTSTPAASSTPAARPYAKRRRRRYGAPLENCASICAAAGRNRWRKIARSKPPASSISVAQGSRKQARPHSRPGPMPSPRSWRPASTKRRRPTTRSRSPS